MILSRRMSWKLPLGYHSVSFWSDSQLKRPGEYRSFVKSTRDYVFSDDLCEVFGKPQKLVTYFRILNLYNSLVYNSLFESRVSTRGLNREVKILLKHWGVFMFEVI